MAATFVLASHPRIRFATGAMMYFAQGIPQGLLAIAIPAWLASQGVGPLLFREEAKFYREMKSGDELTIDVKLSGISKDHRKWSMRHRILRGDVLCATLDLDGAWLDLRKRRIARPPEKLIERFEALERTEDFQVIGAKKKNLLP